MSLAAQARPTETFRRPYCLFQYTRSPQQTRPLKDGLSLHCRVCDVAQMHFKSFATAIDKVSKTLVSSACAKIDFGLKSAFIHPTLRFWLRFSSHIQQYIDGIVTAAAICCAVDVLRKIEVVCLGDVRPSKLDGCTVIVPSLETATQSPYPMFI